MPHSSALQSLVRAHAKEELFLIAEAGTNHNGSLDTAKAMVDAASAAGAAAIKFQYVIASEILHPKTGLVSLPGGSIPLFERFRELECPVSFYRDLKDYADRKKILFLCTPFGPKSAEELGRMGVAAFKIASPEVTYFSLLGRVAEFRRPLLLSTGVTELADLRQVRNYLKAFPELENNFTFLHCITQYPAPEHEYNLLLLLSLPHLLNLKVPVGLSDHTLDAFFIPKVAYTISRLANRPLILEKHLTLDKKGTGLDDPIAIDQNELSQLVSQVKQLSRTIQPQKSCEEEWRQEMKEGVLESVTRLLPEYSRERIASALGDGVKALAPSEAGNYLTTRRSLRAIRDISKDERLDDTNSGYLRSEKNLSPGIFPVPEGLPKGTVARTLIKDGEAITLDKLRARI
ncbi:MAG: N-acetylneuraminate synthase family protein [Spirochaetia bacterium]|nr:N-acetylneuraminate synthase family protein [Spirochaetia bacterium]